MTDRVVAQLNVALADRYQVIREIGAGGMATVFLARDLRHQRNVALKVLNPELGAVLGGERFLAEIQVTANLQHPNLLPLFDSGESDGLLFYVMPFVDGETLRGRLDREKQLPVEDALRLAIAVGGALSHAHRHGVIHRDLKPENVLLHEGEPLVADFGIALAVSKAGGARITQTGISLGTPQYMSPEQAMGDRAIDARTDVYSLAAVLYEMLTGDPPHTASTSQGVIAKLVTDRPRSVRQMRPAVPEHVEAALERALEKLPADRWGSVSDFADALSGRTTIARTARSMTARSSRRNPVVVGALAVALVALGAAGMMLTRPLNRDEPPVVRFTMTTPAAAPPAGGLTVSPDGRVIVYAAATSHGSQLYSRPLDQTVAQPIAGTEGATPQAVFSPDGKWIAFIADGKLKKVPASGGTPIALASATGGTGMDWSVDNTIVLGAEPKGRCLQRVSANGGQLASFVKLDPAMVVGYCGLPIVLADGKTVVFAIAFGASGIHRGTALTTLDDGEVDTLSIPFALPMGVFDRHLLYATEEGAVMAVPIDMRHRRVSAQAVTILDGVSMCVLCMGLAIPHNGTIAYAQGGAPTHLSWVAEHDTAVDVASESRPYTTPRLSPDGRSIAFGSVWGSGTRADISLLDVATGTVRRLTSEGDNSGPAWTPDGKHVLYASVRDGNSALWLQSVAEAAPAERVTDPSRNYDGGEVSPDGRTILARMLEGKFVVLDTISLTGDRTPHPFLHLGSGNAAGPRFSPDGHWFVHNSNQTGRREVYVRSFSNPSTVIPVSSGGGTEAVWSRDGRHLFYRSADSKVIDVTVTTKPTFAVLSRRVGHDDTFAVAGNSAGYDVSIDGKRLLVVRSSVEHGEITVVTNWLAEVRRRLEKEP